MGPSGRRGVVQMGPPGCSGAEGGLSSAGEEARGGARSGCGRRHTGDGGRALRWSGRSARRRHSTTQPRGSRRWHRLGPRCSEEVGRRGPAAARGGARGGGVRSSEGQRRGDGLVWGVRAVLRTQRIGRRPHDGGDRRGRHSCRRWRRRGRGGDFGRSDDDLAVGSEGESWGRCGNEASWRGA
uniref:Uncharacterized protein n=1 Tax=Arundo donax TaxID=35708 RepID=A0A0A9DET1_ARUDO